MGSEGDWQNPITAKPGEIQHGVDPLRLRPSRIDLIGWRLELQRGLMQSGVVRKTLIEVTSDGVIVDGHHGVRAAAEVGLLVAVKISSLPVSAKPGSILELDVR